MWSSIRNLRRMILSRLIRNFVLGLCLLTGVILLGCLLVWNQLPALSTRIVFHSDRGIQWLRKIPEYLDPTPQINCSKIFHGDQNEISKARYIRTFNKRLLEDYDVLRDNCTEFLSRRKYFTNISKEEEKFPIAFSIVMYKDFEQFERLLRAVYRPSNVYCVHVDAKASGKVRDAVKRLATCLPRVFLASHAVRVEWGTFSVLEAELVCMRDLLNYKGWRYIINLTGQEYPLKTNRQLVSILTAYGGANDIEGTIKRMANRVERWGHAGPPPHNIRAVKGAVHIVANRNFVEYAIYNPISQDLLSWVKKTKVPDETYFATLNHNPQLNISGSYKGEPETDPVIKPFLARYKIWLSGKLFRGDCHGKYVRHICIFGVGDLETLSARKELIANKFHQDFEPAALECMERWYESQVQDEMEGKAEFNVSYYKTLGFVKNKVT